MKITATTRVCGTMAYPNRRTTAPIMHNAGFEALGIDYRYFAFEPKDIGAAMSAIRTLDFIGVSVSKPYKEAVIPHLDELDDKAARIGAVNIVHNVNGHLKGYNSDWIGAVEALKEHGPIVGRRAAVLGSGGAARAVVFGLVEEGCATTIFARSQEKGEALASEMGATYGGPLEAVTDAGPDVVVNATPIGREEDDIPASDALFHTARTVMDIVVRPDPSPFLRRAAGAGTHSIGGVRMLVLQGAFTFELFTGKRAPVEVMHEAVLAALRAAGNH